QPSKRHRPAAPTRGRASSRGHSPSEAPAFFDEAADAHAPSNPPSDLPELLNHFTEVDSTSVVTRRHELGDRSSPSVDQQRAAPLRLAKQLRQASLPLERADLGWLVGHGSSEHALHAQHGGRRLPDYCQTASLQAGPFHPLIGLDRTSFA